VKIAGQVSSRARQFWTEHLEAHPANNSRDSSDEVDAVRKSSNRSLLH